MRELTFQNLLINKLCETKLCRGARNLADIENPDRPASLPLVGHCEVEHGPQHVPVHLYRVTSLTRNRTTLGPYSRPVPRALWWS